MKIIFMFEWGSGNIGWNETYKRDSWLKYCRPITIRTLVIKGVAWIQYFTHPLQPSPSGQTHAIKMVFILKTAVHH